MTEAGWLNEDAHAQGLVYHLGTRGVARTTAGRRKLRLFACGCCRVAWDVLPDDRLRDAVLTAERFADERATKDELAAMRTAVAGLRADAGPFGTAPAGVRVAIDKAVAATAPQAYAAAFAMTATTAPLAGRMPEAAAVKYLCQLVRCVFGNPFRPAVAERAWRAATVVVLAHAAYEGRAFDRLPVLADALEEAGCTDADLLDHLRGPGPFVRGD